MAGALRVEERRPRASAGSLTRPAPPDAIRISATACARDRAPHPSDPDSSAHDFGRLSTFPPDPDRPALVGTSRDGKDEEKKAPPPSSGPSTAPSAPAAARPTEATDPCGGGSKADSFVQTDKGVTVTVDPKDPGEFGNTSKLAAFFAFGACSTASGWRFFLKDLTVRVASAVQDLAWSLKTHVADAKDPAVSAGTYKAIMDDLRPNTSGTARRVCAGKRYPNKITNYSARKTYWNRPIVVDHEAFHRSDWDTMYRAELRLAEQQVWGHVLPAAEATKAEDAIAKARPTLDAIMIEAYNPRACDKYTPEEEVRAYTAGAPAYRAMVDAIDARAKAERWS